MVSDFGVGTELYECLRHIDCLRKMQRSIAVIVLDIDICFVVLHEALNELNVAVRASGVQRRVPAVVLDINVHRLPILAASADAVQQLAQFAVAGQDPYVFGCRFVDARHPVSPLTSET